MTGDEVAREGMVGHRGTATATFLFCDLVGSTDLLTRLGDDAGDEVRRSCYSALRRTIDGTGGREIKSTGDGFLVVFPSSVGDATACGVEMQRALARLDRSHPLARLGLRVGISVGEAVNEDGDWYGTPVVEAARLCAAARSGQILVADLVPALVGSRGGHRFASLGTIDLKGLEPLAVSEVAWEPEGTPVVLPMPSSLDAAANEAMVDRWREREVVLTAWRAATGGRPAVVLLTGEAGIGRTRLAAEVARTVHADGAAVLYGRCREEVGRPYEPFSEALSWYAGVCPPDELGLQLGAAAGELVRLVPGLASRLPDLPAPSSGRERLLDAVATVLDAIAASRPTLLVLDDLHLATPPTIAMLARVVESAGGRPLLVLATACDGLPGADVGDDLLTELRRHGDTEHVPLTGLDDAAVAELLARATGPGEHVDPDRAAALRAESEGNPAILIRLVREAAAGGAGILECPYMGLAPFQPEDGGLFFGRDDIVDGLLSRLAQSRVLGLVGASGSGKSSVIRAGVLPAIWRGALPSSAAWRVVIMAPGRHPLAELAAKVALLEHGSPSRLLRDLEDDPRTLDLTTRQLLDGVNPDARVLLVVDQLEELFTICEQPSERQAFVDAVVHAVTVPGGRTAVLTAIRADFYGHVAFDERLAGALESNHVLLGPLREEDLRAAIERPAAAVGLRLEPGLVDLVVHDVDQQPGALPLVSHAMAETWKHRRGRTLTIAGYRETGGVRGALATTAEAVYAVLARDEQQVAKRLLLRLIEVGDGSEDTARRARREELDDGDDAVVGRVLNRLVEARLLLADDTSVEIAHEALIRAWPRLTAWLDEDRNQLRVFGHLRDSARAWERSGHDDSELYRGARLAAVLDLVAGGEAGLDGLERDFLAACRAREEADLRAAEQSAVSARRANRRLRGLLGAAAVLLVVALVAGAVALDRQADADAARRLADARRVGAAAQVEQAVDKALLLAVAGVQLEATGDTRANLLATLDRSADVVSVTRIDFPLEGLALSSVDGRLVVGDDRTGLYAIDPAGEGWDTTDTVAGIKPRTMAYVPSRGELLAVFDGPFWRDNQIGVVDADTLQSTGTRFTGFNGPNLYDVAADPDGRFVAAAGDDFPDGPVVLVVWDREHPEAPRVQIEVPGAGLGGIAFSPDGGLLHVTTSDGHVAYDTATWTPGGGFHAEGPLAVALDGTVAAVTEFYDGPGRRVGIFDPSGELVVELVGHQAQVNAVAFAPSGDMVATASDDETVAVWDPATGDRIDLFHGHSDRVASLAFSPDGDTLYSAGYDGALIAWDVSGRQGLARQVREPFGPSDPVEFALPMAGGGSVYSLPDQSLIVRSDDGIAVGPVGAEFGPVAWSDVAPDGRIAVVGRLGEVVVLDGQTLELEARGQTMSVENFGAIAFGPESDTFVVAARDGIVREYTAGSVEETGRSASVAPQVPFGVRRAGPDTAVVLALGPTDDVPTLVAVDLESGETSTVVDLPGLSMSTAAIDATGRLGAVGSQDGRIVVVDLVTGETIGPPVAAHVGPIATIAFARDSGELISSGFDGRLAFWDAATGDLLGTVRPGPENLFARASYQDADTIVVAYEDGSVYEFDRDPAAWIERACVLAGRDLTEEEWRDAFDDRPYRPTCPQD